MRIKYEKPLALSVACINASSWGHQGKLKRILSLAWKD